MRYLLAVVFLLSTTVIMAGNDVTRKTLDLPDFHSVAVNSGYTVYIKQHHKQEVTVEALSDIYAMSEFTVKNGVLHVNVKAREESKNSKSIWKKIDDIKISPTMNVVISMKEVRHLQVNGSGKIITENSIASNNLKLLVSGSGSIELDLKGTTLDASLTGTGSMFIKGYTSDYNVNLSGTGSILSYQLESEKAKAHVSGPGVCEMNVASDLLVEVFGDGQLFVKGDTKKISSQIYGQGFVKRVH